MNGCIRMKNRRSPGVLTRIGSSPARRLHLPLLAALFVTFMTAAGSAGAPKSYGDHHDNMGAASVAHHSHASNPACSADCDKAHGTGAHSHGDQSDTCCGFACHMSIAEAYAPLILPPGRSEQGGRRAHSIRVGGSNPFEHPPRTAAIPLA